MRWCALVLVAVALVTAVASPDEKGKKDMDQLQGTWACVSAQSDGKPIPEDVVKQLRLVLARDQYTTSKGDQVLFAGTFTLNADRTPKELDIVAGEGESKGQVAKGIYDLDGDTLKLCYPLAAGKDRPKEFASTPGSGLQVAVWKRTRP
jgi:uncharacterized protein (TIGR03067 family)